MANRCGASLDPTWAHLPTPAPTHTAHAASHYYSPSAAAFENEALTSALRASMAPPAHAYSSAAASSFSSPATPSSSTTTTSSASELQLSASSGGGGHDDAPAAPAAASTRRPARARRALKATGPSRAGRVTKQQRKPRPSRRPQTTYITADPANFRRMVQETTGLPVVHVPGSSSSFHGGASEAVRNWTTTPAPAPACVLPTLDTSAFLLDRAAAASVLAAPEEKSLACGGHASSVAAAAVAAAAAGDDGSAAALLELEALVCAAAGEYGFFPTLERWWIG